MPPRSSLVALAAAALLSACAAGPDYVRPTLAVPAAWKESGDWKPADPRPAASGLSWWAAYRDAALDGLESDALNANQNIRQAEAAYHQAKAIADADRTGLAAGRNERRFLLQTYRRDMGGGQRVLMKDLSAPITVQGRHWGGLRLAYSF